MKKHVVNLMNKKVSEIELPDSIFDIKVFPDLQHQYIRYQNSKSRQGSHKTKTRSEIRGGAKKPFSQKGTGNARQGSSKPPNFRGGAISMGPQNRDHSFSLNKK
jgi:large subunit ribosomal protein L4